MSGTLLVRCAGVGVTYGRGSRARVALHGTDCEVAAGDRIALTGASGSGKSTLLHVLAGLQAVTSGSIEWPQWSHSPGRRPDLAGVVFQAASLVDALDVAENVALPLRLTGMTRPEATQVATDALAAAGVADLGASLPEELSGGQAQRVVVARVLASRPSLILADEPTGKLDRETGRYVVDALVDAADELGAALVIATHDEQVAARLGTRWAIRDGRLTGPDRSPTVAVPR